MTREPRTSTGQWFWRGNAVKGSEAQLARTLCAIEDEAQSMRWPAASPSRDTEIERIAAVLRRANWPIDGHGRYGAVPSGQVKDAASRLYSAGLRSQPASEPSLDVSPGALTKAVMDVTDELHLGIYSTEGGASWFDRRRFALLLAARLAEKP